LYTKRGRESGDGRKGNERGETEFSPSPNPSLFMHIMQAIPVEKRKYHMFISTVFSLASRGTQ